MSCGIYSCVWREIRKPLPGTLRLASAREGLASAGLNFHIASAAPFRNGCFAEFAGLLPQVRAQVLRRRFVWANHFNRQQRMQAYIKRAKTQASTSEMAQSWLSASAFKPLGLRNCGGSPIHNWPRTFRGPALPLACAHSPVHIFAAETII